MVIKVPEIRIFNVSVEGNGIFSFKASFSAVYIHMDTETDVDIYTCSVPLFCSSGTSFNHHL